MTKEPSALRRLTGETPPVIGYPKTIQFGPVTLDGYMLEDGSFRQSVKSTGRSLGMASNKSIQLLVAAVAARIAGGAPENPLLPQGSEPENTQKQPFRGPETTLPVLLPVKVGPNVAYTINLPMVVEIWKAVAKSDRPESDTAFDLLGLSAAHSLERVYQEAFGVADARTTNDRLLEWAIRLEVGKHFPLFGGEFHKQFARVTGFAIGHRQAAICLAELVYWRLPLIVYDTIKDLNPYDAEKRWRQFNHSQLMTDELREHVRGIVMTVTNQMANTSSKIYDKTAYRHLLWRLDRTLPRHRKRGREAQALSGETDS